MWLAGRAPVPSARDVKPSAENTALGCPGDPCERAPFAPKIEYFPVIAGCRARALRRARETALAQLRLSAAHQGAHAGRPCGDACPDLRATTRGARRRVHRRRARQAGRRPFSALRAAHRGRRALATASTSSPRSRSTCTASSLKRSTTRSSTPTLRTRRSMSRPRADASPSPSATTGPALMSPSRTRRRGGGHGPQHRTVRVKSRNSTHGARRVKRREPLTF